MSSSIQQSVHGVDAIVSEPPRKSRPRRASWRSGDRWAVVVFLAPTFLLLVVFLLIPIIQSFRLSTLDWDGLQPHPTPVGLDNWKELFQDPIFWKALRNSVFLAVVSVAVQIPIGLSLAILLDRGGRRFRVFKIGFFFPLLMSSVAVAILFQGVFDNTFGLLNTLLEQLGLGNLTQDWLGNPNLALWSVQAVVCWQFIPFYMLLFLAALQGIPEELHEAALLDGVSKRQYTRKIQIPMLRGAIATAALLIVIGSLKYFDLIWVMTGGGPEHSTSVLATYMYEQAFRTYRVGYGATIATALFIFVFVVALIVMRMTRQAQEDR